VRKERVRRVIVPVERSGRDNMGQSRIRPQRKWRSVRKWRPKTREGSQTPGAFDSPQLGRLVPFAAAAGAGLLRRVRHELEEGRAVRCISDGEEVGAMGC
jgi:hypothetical protein